MSLLPGTGAMSEVQNLFKVVPLCNRTPASSFSSLVLPLLRYPRLQTCRILCGKRTGKQRYPSEKRKLKQKQKQKEGLAVVDEKSKFEGFWRLSKLTVSVQDDPGKDFLEVHDGLLQQIPEVLEFPVASMLPRDAFTVVRKSSDARKVNVSLERIDSKKLNFHVIPSHSPDQFPVFTVTSCIHKTGASLLGSSTRRNKFKVSQSETKAPRVSKSSDSVPASIPNPCPKSYSIKGVRKVYRGDVALRSNVGRYLFGHGGELNVDYSAIKPNLSLDCCNSILKQLVRCNDDNSLKFFGWMNRNGKLVGNVTACKLVLQVLGRKEDWKTAETMISEFTSIFGCELDFQVFNALIYACCRKGLIQMGTRWFQMMLDKRVLPNVVTFGMVMGLYQRGSKVKEAEFAFSQMRNYGILCQSAYSAMVTIYTRLGMYDKAEAVIHYMREDKLMLDKENWSVMLNAYSQQGKLKEARMTMTLMQESGISPNIVAYNTLITGCGKASDMDAAHSLFRSISQVRLEPNETTYRSMLEGWGHADNYKMANLYYKEMRQLGFKPNSTNIKTLINLEVKHGTEDTILGIVDDMLKMGCQHASILSTLLRAYEKASKFDKLSLLMNGSLYEHVLVDQTSCSILVMSYVKQGLVDDAIHVLRTKSWKDPIFEDNLIHFLLCSCKELGYHDNAVKIFSHMVVCEKRPNLHIICTMIDIYSAMDQFTEAEKLYLRLKSSETPMDMIAYTIVVRMYVKEKRFRDACFVLERMDTETAIVPDVYLFHDMLRIYQICGMQDKLLDMYYKIMKSRITWDQEMYNCVINCCARALPIDELSRIFNEMIQLGFCPSTITFNIMLDVYGKSKLFSKVERVFLMAKQRGLVDVISYNTVIAAYGKSKDLQNMSSTVREMQLNGFSVSLEAYNCMLDSYGKERQMEAFRDVLKRMKSSNCTSDCYTYNIMINIYGEQGWIDDVATILTELKECGPGPDLCSYNTLIKAYGIAGMVEDAVDLVREMRGNEIEPDRITYTNLVTTLRRNDKFLEAVKWSLWMKQIGLGTMET